jgi:RHS repeat-associated protein
VVTRAVGGVEWGYVYDPENRLKEVWRGSERIAFFRYDGEGNRVVREVGGIRTVGVDEGYELRNGGVRKVYRLGGERVAVREGSTVYAAVGDHLGSVTVLAQGGSVAGATRYLPYGAIRWESGLWSTDRRFTGQRWEQGLGLYDYRARFYDPTLGRFLQPDPIVPEPGNPQALNRYAYVYNNPLRYTDPSGHVVDPPQCPWCDRPWISLAGWPPLAVNLAQLGCALLSCHVDHATQMIWGPTTIDWMEAQTLSVAQVGMPASLPTGGLPDIAQREWIRVRLIQRLGETLQPYLKRLEEIAGERIQVAFEVAWQRGSRAPTKYGNPSIPLLLTLMLLSLAIVSLNDSRASEHDGVLN